jgi:hypothetical protein
MVSVEEGDKMGIIEEKVRKVFKDFDEHNDMYRLVGDVALIADYSVRCMSHMQILMYTITTIKNERKGVEHEKESNKRGNLAATPCTTDANC